jgi:hypothetical protein
VRDFASSVTDAIDPDNFDFDLDFSDIFSDTCGTDAIFCGPPNVVFWGGSGSGATGNVIVSAVGDILGVDIVNSGFGYGTRAPFLNFEDSCGRGVGATGSVILGPVSPATDDSGNVLLDPNGQVIYVPNSNGTETGVTGVIVEDSGYGYLPVPDGSQGGDSRVWSDAKQTTVKRSDGTWDIPYDSGELIQLLPGDVVRTPIGSISDLVGSDGSSISIPGGTNFNVNSPGTITSPEPNLTTIKTGDYPIKNDEQYPVILYMCGAIIKNPGVGYQQGDKVIIEPSYGAEITPQFNELGQLTSVKVISGGEGFQQIPTIYIESETGFNAEIVPRFCIDRVGVDQVKEPTSQDKIISVVDCVGRG